jgi:hypothetical protein
LREGKRVLDFLMLALLIAAFAAAVGYVYACVSLTESRERTADRLS